MKNNKAMCVTTHTNITNPETQFPKAPIIHGYKPRHPASRTPWPRLGKLTLANLDQKPDLCKQQKFWDYYEPGDLCFIYSAGSSSCQELARTAKIPIFKWGTSTADLLVRQRDLTRDRYGAWHQDKGTFIEDRGWDDWEMRSAELIGDHSYKSPVELGSRALLVHLPKTLSGRDFDHAIHQAMSSCSLSTFARSAIGTHHFDLLNIDPQLMHRYVRYQFGTSFRMSAVREIYVTRPREDWSRVKRLAEKIIFEHVMKITSANEINS